VELVTRFEAIKAQASGTYGGSAMNTARKVA
jgi:hypothetical protein